KALVTLLALASRVTTTAQQLLSAAALRVVPLTAGGPADDVAGLAALPLGGAAKYGVATASSNAPAGWRVAQVPPEKEGNTHAVRDRDRARGQAQGARDQQPRALAAPCRRADARRGRPEGLRDDGMVGGVRSCRHAAGCRRPVARRDRENRALGGVQVAARQP